MSWLKLAGDGAFHAKVVMAGNEAYGAWVRAGQWSSGHMTEGFVPRDVALLIGPQELWTRLENARLRPDKHGLVEPREGGWQIHDYLDWNPSAEELASMSEAKSRAGRVGGRSKSQAGAKHVLAKNEAGASDGAHAGSRAPSGSGSGSGSEIRTPLRGGAGGTEPSVGMVLGGDSGREREPPSSPKPLPKAETPLQVTWRVWRELYLASAYRAKYAQAPADGKAAKAIAENAVRQLEADGRPAHDLELLLRHQLNAYLRDKGSTTFVLRDRKHGLQWAGHSLSSYGTPWASVERPVMRVDHHVGPAPVIPPLDVVKRATFDGSARRPT